MEEGLKGLKRSAWGYEELGAKIYSQTQAYSVSDSRTVVDAMEQAQVPACHRIGAAAHPYALLLAPARPRLLRGMIGERPVRHVWPRETRGCPAAPVE